MIEKELIWIWFSLINGINQQKLQKLLVLCDGYENLWNAMDVTQLPDLVRANQDWSTLIESILRKDLKENAKRIVASCEDKKIQIVFPGHEDFPTLLKYTEACPMVLYVRGKLLASDQLLAIIGSRTASSYGLDIAYSFAKKLAENGVTIVSGLARGVDTYAHAGALKGKGRTIAVLGNGVDVPYPRENCNLMETIVSNGAVISELPPGTRPSKFSFPQRNRIIAGMSAGVFVTEAGPDSGTRITVDYANEYGKDIFAVPGEITRQNFFGTNKMLKDGAIFVTTPDDIFSAIKNHYQIPENLLDSDNFNLD
ncbi:MAG: DNA-processing protein DprA, partial [Clostridia bacterium]